MGWGSIEEAELEEGEAAYDDDDDHTSIDPDIALSYIDEKLQNVLGHFQKDFEGGVSAENLGAKFGGYGSFLPMYRHSPPTWSQQRIPLRVQNHTTSRSPGNLPTEGGPHNSMATLDAPVYQLRGISDSCSTHLLNNLKSSSVDGLVREDSCLVAEKVSAKHKPPFSKSVNPPDQKKLTVRIRVGSDKVAQRNAAMYSGLGLTSPSSSTGNSPEESCGTPFGCQDIPSETPTSILQFLTSNPVSKDLLLSPLHGHFLNLVTSVKVLVDNKPAAAVKGWHENSVSSADNSASVLRAEEELKGKKSKSVWMGENFDLTKHESEMHSVDNKGSISRKSSGSETLESRRSIHHGLNHKPLSDSVHDIGHSFKSAAWAPEAVRLQPQNIPVKKRDISKDMVKDRLWAGDSVKGESLESISVEDAGKHEHQESRSSSLEKIGKLRVKSSQKGAPLDLKEDGRGKGDTVPASSKADCDISEGKLDSKEAMDHSNQICGPKVAFPEHDESGIPNTKKSLPEKLSSECKKKLKGSQTNGKFASSSGDGCFKSGVPAVVKDKKSAQKNVSKVHDSKKDWLYTGGGHVDNLADPSERPSGDKSKVSSHEGIAGKCGVPDACKERPGFKRFTDKVESEISLKETLNDEVPPTKEMVSAVELVPAAPILIEEHWVCCDRCQKWRLLPYGTKPEQLPDKWICSMLNWLRPGMNRCDISEDETTKALQALYQIPLPETQNNLQNNANSRPLDQIDQNVGSHYVTHQGKKKLKSKETYQTSDNSGPIMNSNLMKNPRQEVGKNRCLKDMNQPLSEANLIKKTKAKHLSKPYNAVEKHPSNREENDIIKGDAKPKQKIKRQIESDQYRQGSFKKIKTEGAVNMDNKRSSECDGYLSRMGVSSCTGWPTEAAPKDKQKHTDHSESDRPQVSIGKLRDSLQGSMGCDFIEVKTYDERGISKKRRKLKDCPDVQDYLDTTQSDWNHFQGTKVLVKEDSSDSGFRAEKKLKLSGSQGKDFKKTNGDNKVKRGGTQARILLSGNRTNTVAKSVEKMEKVRKYKAKLALGITMEDIEALKKDLGSEQVSTTATSSSSKVSDSRRSRANYLEMKGSPVESISSSPMRTSNMNILSPPRMTSSRKDNPKFGDFAARGSFYGDGISESNQSGPARKRKVSSVSHRESFENPVLEFQENKTRGNGVDARPGSGNVHLGNIGTDILERHSPCPTARHAAACYNSKERVSTKHCDPTLRQQKSGIVFSCSNENDKPVCFSIEKTADKVSALPSEGDILNRKISSREDLGIKQNPHTSYHEVVGDPNHPFSDESSLKAFRIDNNLSKRDSGKRLESGKWGDARRENQPKCRDSDGLDVKFGAVCSVDERDNGAHNLVADSEAKIAKEIISIQLDGRSGRSQYNSCHDDTKGIFTSGSKSVAESQKGSPLHVLPCDASSGGEVKVLKSPGNAVHQNGTLGSMSHPASDQCVVRDISSPSHIKTEAPTHSAASALKEAEELRDYADRLKDSGFGFECNEAYFQAALMLLHGASLLESTNSESNKHGEMSQMEIYSSAAKICETCALEYENRQEMAASALAYKCTEVAYMRVVYCKNASTNRVWQDLQASLQMIPQGESPSSSASDIDNLTNQLAVDKAAPCKANGCLAGNHINGPRNRPNFVRLLDLTKDVNSAMEASMKSQNAFAAAANMTLEQAQKKAIISSVKRVIDFSFQDVEELVRLVRHAIGSISR